MSSNQLEIEAKLQIQKPIEVVFEGVADPKHMCGYFISKSTGRMTSGAQLVWNFPEFDMDVPVRVGEVVSPSLITYFWDNHGVELEVKINFEEQQDGSTLVRILEGPMENNEAGINWLKGNSFGWSNFLACLKAYLEYNINLRKGAFDYMRK